jgi:DNA-binding GntR family transcriptional regulator
MTTTINPSSPVPMHVCVADAIALRIVTGEYAGKLPADRELAQEFGVAYGTLRRAMGALRDRKLIVTCQGRGSFTGTTG